MLSKPTRRPNPSYLAHLSVAPPPPHLREPSSFENLTQSLCRIRPANSLPPSPLAGALFTAIAPSAIAIGGYFCVADIILISQCVYYNTRNAARRRRQQQRSSAAAAAQTHHPDSAVSADDDEEAPLLSRPRSGSANNGGGLPGSHRRQSVRRGSSGLDPLARMVTGEDETPQRSAWVTNGLSLVAVYVLGVAAWFVSREVLGAPDEDDGASAGGDGDGGSSESASDRVFMVVGLALGYTSALCYLTARIPQILKNYREKSTEGMYT